jgi:hypothetical protein
MNLILADVWDLTKARKENYPKNYKVIWNPVDVLILIWQGKVNKLYIPREGTPGYDFVSFAMKLHDNKGIKRIPDILPW